MFKLVFGVIVGLLAVLIGVIPLTGTLSYIYLSRFIVDPVSHAANCFLHGDLEDGRYLHHFVHVSKTLTGFLTNVTFHVVTAGNPANEAVVLAHGLGESWRAWKPIMSNLSNEYYMVAFDSKGNGQSSIPWDLHIYPEYGDIGGNFTPPILGEEIVTMLDQMDIHKFNYVSTDLTSFYSTFWVGTWRSRVLRYLKAQSTVAVHSPTAIPQGLLFLFFPKFLTNLFEGAPAALPRVLYGKPLANLPSVLLNKRNAKPISDEVFNDILSDVVHSGVYRSWVAFYHGFESDLGTVMRKQINIFKTEFDFPITILQGVHDRAQPKYYYDGSVKLDISDATQAARFIMGNFMKKQTKVSLIKVSEESGERKNATEYFPLSPHVKLEYFEDCGHFPHLEDPQRFSKVLKELLEVPIKNK